MRYVYFWCHSLLCDQFLCVCVRVHVDAIEIDYLFDSTASSISLFTCWNSFCFYFINAFLHLPSSFICALVFDFRGLLSSSLCLSSIWMCWMNQTEQLCVYAYNDYRISHRNSLSSELLVFFNNNSQLSSLSSSLLLLLYTRSIIAIQNSHMNLIRIIFISFGLSVSRSIRLFVVVIIRNRK